MMREILDYTIVYVIHGYGELSKSIAYFENEIKNKIKNGYVPCGGISSHDKHFYQAMIKYEEKE